MYSRLLQPPEAKSFFLFGPRGTGKSVWARERFPGAVYLDLLESEVYTDLLASPQRLEQLVPPEHTGWVVLDEVQKVPEILDEVHRLIERKRLKFALTGSSARKLKRKGVNLLGGRALTMGMYPLTCLELEADFDLKRSLRFGQLPSAYVEDDPQAYLESYVKTYLKEEVQQEGLTRNVGAFARFLEAASFSQGSLLNVSAVASDCRVERKVVEGYFTILEDLLLAVRLQAFTKRAKRRITSHPKFYFFDVGVFRTLRPRGPLDSPEEIEGVAIETLVLQEMRALNDYLRLGYSVHYWRTPTGLEVDFVLYGERGLKAIEVKRVPRLRSEDLKALATFVEDYPMAKPWLVYGGTRAYREGAIEVVPLEAFLRELPALLE
ncbi:MAG: ATP-binding protein [Planctomycetes bacterium]|nr:ATP-binding protein [Planctomycetota bacterium]